MQKTLTSNNKLKKHLQAKNTCKKKQTNKTKISEQKATKAAVFKGDENRLFAFGAFCAFVLFVLFVLFYAFCACRIFFEKNDKQV